LPQIDNFEHIGGFIMGIIAGVVFLPSIHFGKRDTKKRLLQVLIAIPVMILLLILLFVLFYSRLPPNWCPACYALDCIEIFDWHC